MLSHVLLSLFDPSPLLSGYLLHLSRDPPLFACLFSLPVFTVLCLFVVIVTCVSRVEFWSCPVLSCPVLDQVIPWISFVGWFILCFLH